MSVIQSAFVFIKPHAVNEKVRELVVKRLQGAGITILSEGSIAAETIDRDKLIDAHYGAIASRAMTQKPVDLVVQDDAQAMFEKAFQVSWVSALEQGLVYNLQQAAEKFGVSLAEVGDKFDQLEKGTTMLKFGGGFYCGRIDGVYVINGFYARMRAQFTAPGTCIYYYNVEWNPSVLTWKSFRGTVLGTTDPKAAVAGSIRNEILTSWQELGLASEPDMGRNGVHASASPFEAMCERANWLQSPFAEDVLGKQLLGGGVSPEMLMTWSTDPTVTFESRQHSLFDLLEDLDLAECAKKGLAISAN